MSSISSNYKDNFNVIEEQLIPESKAEIFCFGETHDDKEGIAKISRAIKELYLPSKSIILMEGIPLGSLKVSSNKPLNDHQQFYINACLNKCKDLDVNMNFDGWDTEVLETHEAIRTCQRVLEVLNDPEISTIPCDDDKMIDKFESLKNVNNSEVFENIYLIREEIKEASNSDTEIAKYRELLHLNYFTIATQEILMNFGKQIGSSFLERNVSMVSAIQEYSQRYSRIFVVAGRHHLEKLDRIIADNLQNAKHQIGNEAFKMDEGVEVVRNELKKHTFHILVPNNEKSFDIKTNNDKQEKNLPFKDHIPNVENKNKLEPEYNSPNVLAKEIVVKFNSIFNHGYCQKNRGEPVIQAIDGLIKQLSQVDINKKMS